METNIGPFINVKVMEIKQIFGRYFGHLEYFKMFEV